MRRSTVLAEVLVQEQHGCPQMQTFIERLARKHAVNLSIAGVRLWLVLPDTGECLLIAGLSGNRVGLTHCVADGIEQLACDTDLVFLIDETGWHPIELLHTDAVWVAYTQMFNATGIASIQDREGTLNLIGFAESWAEQLMQQRWLEDSQSLCV